MSKRSLTLAAKGLILVSLPLLLQLIFVGTLAALLSQAEEERQREVDARLIDIKAAKLADAIATLGADMGYFSMSPADTELGAKFKRDVDVVSEQMHELERLDSKLHPNSPLVDCCKQFDQQKTFLEAFHHKLAANPTGMALMRMPSAMKEYSVLWGELTDRLLEVKAQAFKLEQTSSAEQVKYRLQIQHALFAGVGLNIILGIALAIYFNRGTARRHQVLLDNTMRLARDDKLNPRLEGDDEIAYLDKVFHDMATSLDEARARERALVEHVAVAIAIFDESGNIELCNPHMKLLCSTDAGSNFSALFPRGPTVSAEENLRLVLEKSTSKVVQTTISGPEGVLIPVQLSIARFDTANGDRYVAGIIDISDQQRLQRFKRDLVATVSHELRTPLTSIHGILSMLQMGMFGEQTPKAVESITIAQSSTDRLMKLINDLLDAEKLEAGKMTLHLQPTRLSEVLKVSADAVKGFAEQSGVGLRVSETDAEVYGDSDRLIQVVVNLLSNAIKFSPEGSEVEVGVECLDNQVEVRVRDHGVGIPRDSLDAIFEKFQQVQSAQKNKSGTGLGLPICRAIVEQHHGSIGVSSEEGKGSVFWFRVPVATVVPLPATTVNVADSAGVAEACQIKRPN